MTSYLLIESRDPIGSRGFNQRCRLASALRADGAEVTVFLVENAVLGARAAARLREIAELAECGARVFADEFALRERGLGKGQIAAAVRATGLDALVDQLAAGAKAIWN